MAKNQSSKDNGKPDETANQTSNTSSNKPVVKDSSVPAKPSSPVVVGPSTPKTPASIKTKEEKKAMPPPKMKFSGIDPTGGFKLKFDQRMKFPTDPAAYKKLFSAKVTSASYGTSSKSGAGKRRLQEGENTGFEIVLLGTSEDEISLQLVFDDPSAISSTRDGPDTFSLEIVDLSMFQSAESDKPMDSSSFDAKALAEAALPPIIADPQIGENILRILDVVEIVLYVVIGLIFLLAITQRGSMQSLWSLVRAMQMIFLCTIVSVPYPAESYLFFQGRIFFKLDLLQGQTLAEKFLNFSPSSPVNQKFADFGYESLSFLPNSGSVIIFQVLIILYFFLKAFINFFATCCPRSKSCRKIGMWADEKNLTTKMKSAERKFFLEAYLSLSFCVAISFYQVFSFVTTEDLVNYDYGSYV